MAAHLQAGRIDGFCVGEPWAADAVAKGQGFTLATSQSIWPDHPEKVLACARVFAEQYPNSARALIKAILTASRFIEQSPENRRSTAQLLSASAYLDTPLDSIAPACSAIMRMAWATSGKTHTPCACSTKAGPTCPTCPTVCGS